MVYNHLHSNKPSLSHLDIMKSMKVRYVTLQLTPMSMQDIEKLKVAADDCPKCQSVKNQNFNVKSIENKENLHFV